MLNLFLLGYLQCVIDLDSKVSNGALPLGMTGQSWTALRFLVRL
jgi:hypothetical protein